jgi:hypothetical protein
MPNRLLQIRLEGQAEVGAVAVFIERQAVALDAERRFSAVLALPATQRSVGIVTRRADGLETQRTLVLRTLAPEVIA